MRLVCFLFGLGFLGFVSHSAAQSSFPFQSAPTFDRPGVADAPYSPKKGSFQSELGSGWSGGFRDAKPVNPALLLRYGQTSRFEWRAQWNYAPPLSALDDYLTQNQTQLVAFGGKVRCGQENGLIPDWGFMANVVVDPRYKRTQSQGMPLGGDLYLVTMHNLPFGLSINTNWGLGLFPSSPSLIPLGAMTVNWSSGGSWGFFGEVFGFGVKGHAGQRGWDMGLTCLLNEDKSQIDLSWMDSDGAQKGGGVLLVGYSRNFSKRS